MPREAPVGKEGLREMAIEMSKMSFALAVFDSLDYYKDTLFEVDNNLKIVYPIPEYYDFLKKTSLSDIEIERARTNPSIDTFRLVNKKTGETIDCSNRGVSEFSRELRGTNLINLIEKLKVEMPQENVYDALTKVIKKPEYSDQITRLHSSLCGEYAAQSFHVVMSEKHFDLFSAIVLKKLNEKITNETLRADITHKELYAEKFDHSKLVTEIWSGIDVAKIYDITKGLSNRLEIIKTKSEQLRENGSTKAADEALNLYNNLHKEQNKYLNGEITADEFIKNSEGFINWAQNSVLREHRSFFGNVLNAILVVLNTITGGHIEIKPTDSIQKTIDLKQSLKAFKEIDQTNQVIPVVSPEPEAEQPHSINPG